MEENTIRNPFPKIGKVMKYEFKHSARLLLPLYGILLVLGLFTGLSFDKDMINPIVSIQEKNFSVNAQINSEQNTGVLTGLLILAFTILTSVIVVITIVSLVRRFKQSMLEEEAYLNLSLPCTMGEQLWGRYIMDFLWLICCTLVIFCSFMLCFIRFDLAGIFRELKESVPEIKAELAKHNVSFAKTVTLSVFCTVSFSMLGISLIFAINAVSHLFSNQKGFFKFLSFIVYCFIYSKAMKLLPFMDASEYNIQPMITQNCLLLIAYNILWAALLFAGTQYIFTKKLNLE